jgi:hypothetical protein
MDSSQIAEAAHAEFPTNQLWLTMRIAASSAPKCLSLEGGRSMLEIIPESSPSDCFSMGRKLDIQNDIKLLTLRLSLIHDLRQ